LHKSRRYPSRVVMRLVCAKDDYTRLRPSKYQFVGVPARLRLPERADQYVRNLSVSLLYCPADSGCALRTCLQIA
jgi:hypothetical protein